MDQNQHTRVVEGVRYVWKVVDLWHLSEQLPSEEVDPNTVINLDVDGWFRGQAPTARLVLDHMRRILKADLSYPVILDKDGSIMDGAHRACKAILEGRPKILVKRFRETPPFSSSEPL